MGEHLRGDVSGRPHIPRRRSTPNIMRKSEVRYDEVTVSVDEEVLGLQITMDDPNLMKEVDTGNLKGESAGLFEGQKLEIERTSSPA